MLVSAVCREREKTECCDLGTNIEQAALATRPIECDPEIYNKKAGAPSSNGLLRAFYDSRLCGELEDIKLKLIETCSKTRRLESPASAAWRLE